MELIIEAASATHLGKRANNEDSARADPNLGLYVVADGMGGYEGGEVASRLAVEGLARFLERNVRDPQGTWPQREERGRSFAENLLAAAVERAHLDVTARRTGPLSDMGSTVVAMLIPPRSGQVVLANVGDSRAYRLRPRAPLERLTSDHSMQAEMAAQGLAFPFRNYITRALGVESHAPDLRTLPLSEGDTLMLCSDGLYEAVPEDVIEALLGLPTAQAAADALVAEAAARGAHDNVTVVVARARLEAAAAATG